MRLNLIEDLTLDLTVLVTEMATASVAFRWEAQVDKRDTEFVLGSAIATKSEKRRAYRTQSGFYIRYARWPL